LKHIKRKTNTLRKWFTGAGILLFSAIFIYAGYQIVSYWHAGQESEQLSEELIEKAIIVPDTPVRETKPDEPPIETAPISVDFHALWQENKDIVAWIYCENTPIHYPIVQSEDNTYYLRRLLNGNYNINGTIFLDYRCSSDFNDFNSVIYGHHMKSGEMFGTLPKYKEQEYYNEHPILYLLTPDQNYKAELVAGYLTPSDSETYSLQQNTEGKRAFLENALQNSTFTSGIAASETDRFITLSTCSYEYDNARYVVVGRLNEIE
jgi:sortase, srtB family